MSLGEYSALIREAGMGPPTAKAFTDDAVTHVEVKLVHIFRLDEKWEKFCANVTTRTLDLSLAMMHPIKVLIYTTAASLILYASAQLIRAIKPRDQCDTTKDSKT